MWLNLGTRDAVLCILPSDAQRENKQRHNSDRSVKKQGVIVFLRAEDCVKRPLTFEVLISAAHGGVVYNLSQQVATAHGFLFCQRRRLLCCKPQGFRNQESNSSQASDKQTKSADKQEKSFWLGSS